MLYLDVVAVTDAGGQLVRTPAPGIAVGQTQVVAEADGLPSCLSRQPATLAAGVRPGPHSLTLFRVDSDLVATRLQTMSLTVS